MKRISLAIAIIAITIVAISSCGSKTPINLKESSWFVKTLNGEKVKGATGPLSLKISYATGRIGGYSGCNTFGAELDKAAFDKGFIKIGDIFSTRMGCPGIYVEGVFLNALRTADSYKVEGNKLYFYEKGNRANPIIVFESAPKAKEEK